MIDYATYRRIHHLNEAEALNVAQIAKRLALDSRTVRYWLDELAGAVQTRALSMT